MKKIVYQLNSGKEREDDVREIVKILSSDAVPKVGKVQVVIQNTPANTKFNKQCATLRVIAKTVSEQLKIDENQAYFVPKMKFGLDILAREDNAIKFQLALFNQFASRAKTDDQYKIVEGKRVAMIHALVRMNRLSEKGIDEVISKTKKYWIEKGVKFD